jgi:hypothetical protein
MDVVSYQVSRISFQELSKNQNRTLPSAVKIRGVVVSTAEEADHLTLSRQVIEQSWAELHVIEDKLDELKAQHSIFFSEQQQHVSSAYVFFVLGGSYSFLCTHISSLFSNCVDLIDSLICVFYSYFDFDFRFFSHT